MRNTFIFINKVNLADNDSVMLSPANQLLSCVLYIFSHSVSYNVCVFCSVSRKCTAATDFFLCQTCPHTQRGLNRQVRVEADKCITEMCFSCLQSVGISTPPVFSWHDCNTNFHFTSTTNHNNCYNTWFQSVWAAALFIATVGLWIQHKLILI